MSKKRKVLTENPVIDELVYNGRLLMNGCILKDQKEADNYETFESIKQSDFYIIVKENAVGFNSFEYSEELLSQIPAFTPADIVRYSANKSLIPKEYRNTLLTLAREEFVNNYVELNEYYRTLAGLPPLDPETGVELDLFLTFDDLDGRYGTVWTRVSNQAHLPLHLWSDSAIQTLEEYGYLETLKEEYPDLKYLNHLGEKKVSIYTARKAEHFECIYLPDCESSDVQNHFYQLLEKNRIVFLKTLYTDAYKFDSDYYDKFIIIMILLQSYCDLINEYAYYIIRRDIFDIRTIKYLFESNGVKFFEDIPIKYQLNLVRNLNRLVKHKSTDRNLIDICGLFGFKSIQLFKFYILKDRTMTGGDYKYTKSVSEKWNETIVPKDENGKCNFIGMVYGNDRYVAISNESSKVFYSEDLKEWKCAKFDLPSKIEIFKDSANYTIGYPRIIYNNTFYIILNGSKIYYSNNLGEEWTSRQLPNFMNQKYMDIIYAQGLYFAITQSIVAYSNDLENWEFCRLGVSKTYTEISDTEIETIKNPVWENETRIIVGKRDKTALVKEESKYNDLNLGNPYNRYEPIQNKIKETKVCTNNADGTYTITTTIDYSMRLPIVQLLYDGERFLALTQYGIYFSDHGTSDWEHVYFQQMSGDIYILGSILNNGKQLFVYGNKEYYILKDDRVYISKDCKNWTSHVVANKDENDDYVNRYNCHMIKFANNRCVIFRDDSSIYMSDCRSENYMGKIDKKTAWEVFDTPLLSNSNCLCYGNMKFVLMPSISDSKIAYYYTCNSAFTETSTESIVTYDNEDNYVLKFVRVPLQENVLDEINDPGSMFDYYSIIEEDKYWEGDKDRASVKREILDHDFNILRTKYYSIDNIVEFSEITFQTSYFMSMIMNYDIADQLTVPLPFISGDSYPLIDVFVFLNVLGSLYYLEGNWDENNIPNLSIFTEASNILTIRGFNFEVDLNELVNSLYDPHLNKYYDLEEMCGGLTFQIPQTDILTYKELMYIYNNNREIYEYVTGKMIHCEDRRLYEIYKKIYDALFVAKFNLENFSVLDINGNIIRTYDTYLDYLKVKQFSMYSYIMQEIKPLSSKERKITISNVMNDIVTYVQDMTPILDNGELEHIWHGLPTIDMDFVRHYITEVIKFFKSFKAELLSVSTMYKMADKFDNTIWVIDTLHLDCKHDWIEFLNIYENIESNVDMTKEEKIRLKEFMFKEVYSIIDKALSYRVADHSNAYFGDEIIRYINENNLSTNEAINMILSYLNIVDTITEEDMKETLLSLSTEETDEYLKSITSTGHLVISDKEVIERLDLNRIRLLYSKFGFVTRIMKDLYEYIITFVKSDKKEFDPSNPDDDLFEYTFRIDDRLDEKKTRYDFEMNLYWFEKMFRTYLVEYRDSIPISSNVEIRSFWISDNYDILFSDPEYYSDN